MDGVAPWGVAATRPDTDMPHWSCAGGRKLATAVKSRSRRVCDFHSLGIARDSRPPTRTGSIRLARPVASSVSTNTPHTVASPSEGARRSPGISRARSASPSPPWPCRSRCRSRPTYWHPTGTPHPWQHMGIGRGAMRMHRALSSFRWVRLWMINMSNIIFDQAVHPQCLRKYHVRYTRY